MSDYPPTSRATPTRHRERARYDRETVHGVLDAGYLGYLGFLHDGRPSVLPMMYARVGERLYLHGSTGGRPLREAASDEGLPVCLAVTQLAGLVLARSAMHHSVNHRSVVVHGCARVVTDPQERARAFDAILDAVAPGRSADVRGPSRKESAQTAVLALDLIEVSAKVRSGGPNDDPEDADLPYWSGVLPVRSGYGTPVPADDLPASVQLPDYLAALTAERPVHDGSSPSQPRSPS